MFLRQKKSQLFWFLKNFCWFQKFRLFPCCLFLRSSLHSGRAAEENEPPVVGSFTCFQLMDLETTEKTTSTNTNYQNSILFNLDDDPNTEQPEDDGDLDDGLQFDFD